MTEANPLITVIVTTYNRRELLDKALQAILNQTFGDFELIVGDNYSDYDFNTYIQGLNDKRISSFQNHNHNIIAANRNIALKMAKGKYLAFCDDDDIWLPNKLERQLEIIRDYEKESESPFVVIHSNTIVFHESNPDYITDKWQIKEFRDFYKGNPLSYSTVFVLRADLISFDEDLAKRAMEDCDLWLKLLCHGCQFHLINEPLVRYRDASTSASKVNISYSYLRYIYVVLSNILKYKPMVNYWLGLSFFMLKLLFKFAARSIQRK